VVAPPNPPAVPRYRTGDDELDDGIRRIAEQVASGVDADLVFEAVVSVARMGLEAAPRRDLKIVTAALKELRHSFRVFEPYMDVRKVTIFGSARVRRGDPAYSSAAELGAAAAAEGWMVMTGAGPGIMAAGIEGAGIDNSFGIGIQLPFEPRASGPIADDPKLINFRYFFTRKLTFMKESDAFVLLPGGFGTLDEAFELLTLMQTGKTYLAPIILLDPPGSTYWERWTAFVRDELASSGLISPHDLDLVVVTSDVEEAVRVMTDFYRTYHSMRFVGRRLVLRLHRVIPDDELADLNEEFADIVESGNIERSDPTPSEVEDDDQLHLHRLAFRFDRASYSRLHRMVNRLNAHAPD
jgi:uncharacterized protein (TIGR00730 family)